MRALLAALLFLPSIALAQPDDREVRSKLSSDLQLYYWDESANTYKVVPFPLSIDMDGRSLGLGDAACRITFDEGTPDELEIMDCHLGVGTNAPESVFHAADGDSGATIPVDSNFTFETDGATIAYFFAPAGLGTGIRMGDVTDTDSAQVIYNATTGGLVVGTRRAGEDLIFRAGDNAEKMRIESGGDVGIGITNPTAALHLDGDPAQLRMSSSVETFDFLFESDAADANFNFTYSGSGGQDIQVQHDGDVALALGGGSVGVGTAGPGSELDVSKNQNSDTFIRATNADAGTSARAGFHASVDGADDGFLYMTSSAYSVVADWADSLVATVDSSVDGGIVLYSADEVSIQNATGTDLVSVTGSQVVVEADMFFSGSGSGLAYGGISITGNSTATTISTASTPVQVLVFDTNDPANLTTPDHTNDHVTVDKAGDYYVSASVTLNSVAGSGSTAQLTVEKNNGASVLGGLIVDRSLAGGGSESGSLSLSGFVTLAASDTVELWIANNTGTENYLVVNATLNVMQVGG